MTTRDPDAARTPALLEGAVTVFLRHGFRKTSMEDLARAAGLARQGLYLLYPNKAAVFRAAVDHLAAGILRDARAALDADATELEERLLAAFEGLHGRTVNDGVRRADVHDLLGAADALATPAVTRLRADFERLIAARLDRDGVAARWRPAGLTAGQLGQHLFAAADGVRAAAPTRAAYRSRVRVAVAVVVRGGCGPRDVRRRRQP